MGHQPAELVSPMVAFLAHRSCELTGGLFDSSGGTVAALLVRHDPGPLEPAVYRR